MDIRTIRFAVLLAGIPDALLAQRAGDIEIAGHVAGSVMDRSLRQLGGAGVGADAAIYLAPRVALELGASYTPASVSDWSTSHLPTYLRLRYSAPIAAATSLVIGGGWVHNAYHGFQRPDDGLGMLLGIRRDLTPATSLRASLLLDHMRSPSNASASVQRNTNTTLQLGAAMLMGRNRPARHAEASLPAPQVATAAPAPVPPPADTVPAPAPARVDTVIAAKPAEPVAPAPVQPEPTPVAEVKPPVRVAFVLRGVTFHTGRATLTPQSTAILDSAARALASDTSREYEVAGHTDDRGARPGNLALSQRRAETVRAYLIARGVDASRLTAKGYGPDEPVARMDSVDGRATNRRVELRPKND